MHQPSTQTLGARPASPDDEWVSGAQARVPGEVAVSRPEFVHARVEADRNDLGIVHLVADDVPRGNERPEGLPMSS